MFRVPRKMQQNPQWGVEAAVKVFPDLKHRRADVVCQALNAMRSHPPTEDNQA